MVSKNAWSITLTNPCIQKPAKAFAVMQELLERALLSASVSTKPQWLFLSLFTKSMKMSHTSLHVKHKLALTDTEQYLPTHPQQIQGAHYGRAELLSSPRVLNLFCLRHLKTYFNKFDTRRPTC